MNRRLVRPRGGFEALLSPLSGSWTENLAKLGDFGKQDHIRDVITILEVHQMPSLAEIAGREHQAGKVGVGLVGFERPSALDATNVGLSIGTGLGDRRSQENRDFSTRLRCQWPSPLVEAVSRRHEAKWPLIRHTSLQAGAMITYRVVHYYFEENNFAFIIG